MKWADGRLVAAGLVKGGGVIDWIAPDTFRVERRLTAGRTDRGVFFTNEGMAVAGDQLFLLPEDDHSRLFVFPLR